MLLYGLMLITAVAQTPVRVTPVPWPANEPLAVTCPRDQVTRIVFPEPLKSLKPSGLDRVAFGLSVERATPETIVVLRPTRHPAHGELEFRGPTLSLRLKLSTVAQGETQELRLLVPGSPAPPPGPSASVAPANPTASSPTPNRAVPKATPAVSEDATWDDLQWAHVATIGRREGLPGQPALIVEDALIGEIWVTYRLRLENGAREELAAMEWEHGTISDVRQTVAGADRRLLVRLPRRLISRHTRLMLRLGSGRTYRVAPFPPTVGGLFRRLFK